ncbi:MAG: thioredoxin-dependent thiol peroxidase [Anaerolineae bacterium]|nr:thioredoxin-dependent thiol peroxidase [Thermoflexales bacterium]MDW8406297.1 thioredoxin-dependent thiol peroxidase [Anaerolineae bacterium]
MLQPGDPIPEFALASSQGGEVRSSDLRGKRYVLYFYPKDDTPGCTTEACSFRDALSAFNDIGAPVFGVSPDDIAAHQKFVAKYALNFPLLADPEHKLIEAIGAWVEKSMYGKKYMGVQRSTFVVDPDGRIEKVWPKVSPEGHAEEVLAYLRSAGSAETPSVQNTASRVKKPSKKQPHTTRAKRKAEAPTKKASAKKPATRQTADSTKKPSAKRAKR